MGPLTKPAKPDFTKCCEEIAGRERFNMFSRWQCTRTRGHGPDGEYCKTHDPAVKKAKNAKADLEYQERRRVRSIELAGHKFLAILRLIAEGHNDARGLAAEAIKDFPKEAAND
jgi:hypothetical protein